MFNRPDFLLLNLPVLCISNVIRNLTVLEILEFSLLSRKMYQIVKRARVPTVCLDLLVSSYQSSVKIYTGVKGEDSTFSAWTFIEHLSDEWQYWEQYLQGPSNCRRRVGGVEMDFIIRRIEECDQLASYSFEEDTSIMIRAGIKYVQDLFGCPFITLIVLFPDDFPGIRPLSRLGVRECRQLAVVGQKEMPVGDYLAKMIEEVKISEMLELEIPIERLPFEMSKLGSEKIFIFGDQSWINRDVLFSLKCDQIYFCDGYNSLTSDDVNEFVDRWFHSDEKTFEVLFLRMQVYEKPSDFEKYQSVEWREETRSRFYHYKDSAINLSRGDDIQRKDGLLATIFFYEEILFFGVWHNRFPCLDNIKEWKFKDAN